jgi:L1 cell adhesion molecule like protein
MADVVISAVDIIALDIGTSSSRVAIYKADGADVVADSDGHRSLPTVVAYSESGTIVGYEAKQQQGRNLTNTFDKMKKLIATKNNEDLQALLGTLPYKTTTDKNGKISFEVQGEKSQTVSMEDLFLPFINKMKETAESALGSKVNKCVVAVPPHFDADQKMAMVEILNKAQLKVLKTIVDPACAALAYNLSDPALKHKTVIVVDFGAGLDISLLSINSGIISLKQSEDLKLGGDALVNNLVNYCIDEFKKKIKQKDVSINSRSMHKLKLSCENALKALSQMQSVNVEVESMYEGVDFMLNISRARFESLNDAVFRKILEPIQKVLTAAQLDKSQLDGVVLVGGLCKIPRIKAVIEGFFNTEQKKMPLFDTINPEEVVAFGAAIEASELHKTIEHNKRERKTNKIKAKPEAFLEEIDVLAAPVGILNNGNFVKVIYENTPVPFKRHVTVSTSEDNQSSIELKVGEGRDGSAEAVHLATLVLKDLQAKPKGTAKINVVFTADKAGSLTVKMSEQGTDNSTSVKIEMAK